MELVAGRMLRPSTPPSVARNAVKTDIKPGELAKLIFFSVEVRNASLTSILKLRSPTFRASGSSKPPQEQPDLVLVGSGTGSLSCLADCAGREMVS